MKDLLLILVAICTSEFIHNTMEIWGMREKVRWLRISLDGKEHGKWPINIDATPRRVIAFHTTLLLLISGFVYFALRLLNLSPEMLVILGIAILLFNYAFTTWKVDKFHTEIGKLIRNVKQKNKAQDL